VGETVNTSVAVIIINARRFKSPLPIVVTTRIIENDNRYRRASCQHLNRDCGLLALDEIPMDRLVQNTATNDVQMAQLSTVPPSSQDLIRASLSAPQIIVQDRINGAPLQVKADLGFSPVEVPSPISLALIVIEAMLWTCHNFAYGRQLSAFAKFSPLPRERGSASTRQCWQRRCCPIRSRA
jgi:hypothetical protein